MTDSTSTPASDLRTPPVVSVRRDSVHHEIRLELADWKTRTGGVYDLDPSEWEALALPGHLPPHHLFVPDFVIVYASGHTDASGMPVWTDLRLHVGGVPLAYAQDPFTRRALGTAVAKDWNSLAGLLRGTHADQAAPDWLLTLIADHTPFGHLVASRNVPEVRA